MSPKQSEPSTIQDLYVVIGKDNDGNEGVATGIDRETGRTEPLIGGLRRMPRILALAQVLANESGIELQVVKFSSRGNLQAVKPNPDASK